MKRRSSKTRALCLDVATDCGWAVTDGPSGTWNLKPRSGDSAGTRYLHLRARLNETLKAYPDLKLILYEQPLAHRSGQSTLILGGLVAQVQSWCEENRIEYLSVNVGTLKQHATGKGNASKEAMMAAARKQGWNPRDDNECDALWLRDYIEKGGLL